MDYLAPMFNETAYCLGVEKLLGITDQIPERASIIRVLHDGAQPDRVAPGLRWPPAAWRSARSDDAVGFREREHILEILEMITGLRMNHAYIRPGGVAQDLPPEAIDKIRDSSRPVPKGLKESSCCSSRTRSSRAAPWASASST